MTTITPAEAKLHLEQKTAVLLDVRTREEYLGAHIPGSKLIPLNILETDVLNQLPDRSVPVIVYCQSGARSGRAAELLDKMGYTAVFDLGGIGRWPYGSVSGV